MRRRRTFAALAVLAAAAGASASFARAEDLLVTDFTDVPKSPAPGSFRAVVARAQSGDVIRFEHPLVIPLAGNLDIDRSGITVQGGGGFQRAPGTKATKLPLLRIRGSGVVLDGLDLRDVVVSAQPPSAKGRMAGFTVRKCVFHGEGQLAFERCDGAVVEDVVMSLDNTRGRSRSRLPAILDIGGVGTRIERCDVANVRGTSLSAVEVTGMVVRGGRMDADASVAPGLAPRASPGGFQPGELLIESVDFTTRRLTVIRADSRPAGPFRVRGCTAGRMRVSGPSAEVTDNVVGLPDDDPAFAVGEVLLVTNASLRGAMRVERNTSRGGNNGIAVECAHAGADCTVADNVVERAANIGLALVIGEHSVVARNTVTGGLTIGVKIGIALGGDSRAMEVTSNTVHDTGGQGIRVLQEVPGTVLRDNTLRDNAGAGIYVQQGAQADVVGGVVERCGTGTDPFGGSDSGIVFGKGSLGSVEGTTLRDNHGPGVYAWKSAAARLTRLACSGNGGPGIDVERPGTGFFTSKRTAPPLPDDLAFDADAHAVTGRSFAGALVEVYRVEDGPRTGNPGFGEGAEFLADGVAGADGKFSVPVACAAGDLLTVTVTRTGTRAATSEFSQDVTCAGAPIALVSQSSAGVAGDDASGANLRGGFGTTPVLSADGRWVVFESLATNLTADAHNAGDLMVYLRDTATGTTQRVTRAAGGSFDPDDVGTNGLLGYRPSISEDGRWIAYVTASSEVIAGAPQGGYPYTVLFDTQTSATVPVTDPFDRPQDDPFPSGSYSNYGGDDACICGDGSAVAFVSIGRDWEPGLADLGFDRDLFVWTRATGAVEWISVPTGGGDVPSSTFFGPAHPRLSRDGRFVAFATTQDLTGTGAAPQGAVFVRDRTAGTTEAVSLTEAGLVRTGETPQISADGRFVVFATTAALVASDTNGKSDVYLRDRQTGTTERISVRADGSSFPAACTVPSMSGDGRFVAFQTIGQYVVPDGPTVLNVPEVHLVDRTLHTVAEASVGPGGEAFGGSFAPVLSADGRTLVFQSFASNLLPDLTGDVNRLQLYLRRP